MNELRPEFYWHLADSEGVGSILLHNAHISQGWYCSVSHIAKGDLENALTPYSIFHTDKEKERLWELVRAKNFNDRPSRIKALFAFISLEDAERARREWYPNCDKVIVEMKVSKDANVHIADARHLDCEKAQWPEAAIRYWKEEETANPRMETVINGRVFFPKWEHAPFGPIEKLSASKPA